MALAWAHPSINKDHVRFRVNDPNIRSRWKLEDCCRRTWKSYIWNSMATEGWYSYSESWSQLRVDHPYMVSCIDRNNNVYANVLFFERYQRHPKATCSKRSDCMGAHLRNLKRQRNEVYERYRRSDLYSDCDSEDPLIEDDDDTLFETVMNYDILIVRLNSTSMIEEYSLVFTDVAGKEHVIDPYNEIYGKIQVTDVVSSMWSCWKPAHIKKMTSMRRSYESWIWRDIAATRIQRAWKAYLSAANP